MEKRGEIIQAINDKFAEMSTETILFHQALADILGFHITDHRCMYFLHRYGAMPGEQMTLKTDAEPLLSLSEIRSWKGSLRQSLLLCMKKCINFCLHTLTVNWLSCLM